MIKMKRIGFLTNGGKLEVEEKDGVLSREMMYIRVVDE